MIAGGHKFFGNFVNGMCFSDAVYQYGRTTVMHEGVLDPRLSFDQTNGFQLGDHWKLNQSFLAALIVAVVMAPENAKESAESGVSFSVAGKLWKLQDLWGSRDAVRIHLVETFNLEKQFEWNSLTHDERDVRRKYARNISTPNAA